MAFGAMTFTQGNRNIAAVYKVGAALAEELGALDEATTPPKVYPDWFIDQLGDDAMRKALG